MGPYVSLRFVNKGYLWKRPADGSLEEVRYTCNIEHGSDAEAHCMGQWLWLGERLAHRTTNRALAENQNAEQARRAVAGRRTS